MADVVIIGNGIAGRNAAETLRARGVTGSVLMITDEPCPFYPRPKLSLGYMSGEIKKEDLFAKPDFYSRNAVSLVFGKVKGADAAAGRVTLEDGGEIAYGALLIASGACANVPPWEGAGLDGVTTLRTLADADEILRRSEGQRRVVVAGAGILGVEAAEALCRRGATVTLLARGGRDKVGAPALSPVQAEKRCDMLTEHGVHIVLDDEVQRLAGADRLEKVITKCGLEIETGLIVVTIGARANIGFLKGSGIKTNRGVVVDAGLKAEQSNVFAAGDCAEVSGEGAEKQQYGSPYINAMKQGEFAAGRMAELVK